MALVSPGGAFLSVNRALCAMTGYERDELVRLTFHDITHPDDLAADLSLVDRLLAGDVSRYSLAKRYLHKDGHTVEARLYVSLVRDEAGAPLHFVSQIEDVTEWRRVNARLAQAQRLAALGTLAGGVAHEVNNPLACILSGAHAVRALLDRGAAPGGDGVARGELEEILLDTERAAGRIREVVGALRIFAGEDRTPGSVVDVHAALESTLVLVLGELEGRAALVREYGRVPKVNADEGRLCQLFMNLLVNASHSIAPGAAERNEVRVHTHTDPHGRAVVEIRDTGSGIPPADLARLFEPFFTTRPFGAGTGLGLSVAHGIVSALGGEISAENRPSGGAVLRVTLPGAPP